MNLAFTFSACVLTGVNEALHKRSFTYPAKEVFVLVYSPLVRLHFEYASQSNYQHLREESKGQQCGWRKSLGASLRKRNFKSNQIIFIGLRKSKDCYKRPGGGVGISEGSLGCEFLRGLMCAEGMGCGRGWVRWVLRGTGTASGHPEVP